MASDEILKYEPNEGDEQSITATSADQFTDKISMDFSAQLVNQSHLSLYAPSSDIAESVYNRLHLPSLDSLEEHKDVSNFLESQAGPKEAPSNISSDICGHKSGDSTDSMCHYGRSKQRDSGVDAFGDGSQHPSPYTKLIDKTFPDNLLAKACAEIARRRPENPIRYLAFYLINYDENKERHTQWTIQMDAMMEHKKTLEVPYADSYQEDENMGRPEEEESNFIAEELNYELDNESLPNPL